MAHPSPEVIKAVKALTTLSMVVPNQHRVACSESFDDLLKLVGSNLDEYPFLIGKIPARNSPFGSDAPKTHGCTIEQEDGTETSCVATLDEIAKLLRRSTQMARIYQRDLKYRAHHSDKGPTIPFVHKSLEAKLYFAPLPQNVMIPADTPDLMTAVNALVSKANTDPVKRKY